MFKLRKDSSNNIVRYKARVVARGFDQRYGVDFQETFAPVTRAEAVRLVLTIVLSMNFLVRHIDVKTAYLNGDVDEEIYMKLPDGLENPTLGVRFAA